MGSAARGEGLAQRKPILAGIRDGRHEAGRPYQISARHPEYLACVVCLADHRHVLSLVYTAGDKQIRVDARSRAKSRGLPGRAAAHFLLIPAECKMEAKGDARARATDIAT